MILDIEITYSMMNVNQGWPRLVDEECMWLIDRCHDQFDREIVRRHPRHRIWCQPNVRGEDRIAFWVMNGANMGNFPRQIVAENTLEVLSEYMESTRSNLDMDYVTDAGTLSCRLEYWSMDPPILTEVSGETSALAMFRIRYFYRNEQPVNSMTVVMLDR